MYEFHVTTPLSSHLYIHLYKFCVLFIFDLYRGRSHPKSHSEKSKFNTPSPLAECQMVCLSKPNGSFSRPLPHTAREIIFMAPLWRSSIVSLEALKSLRYSSAAWTSYGKIRKFFNCDWKLNLIVENYSYNTRDLLQKIQQKNYSDKLISPQLTVIDNVSPLVTWN